MATNNSANIKTGTSNAVLQGQGVGTADAVSTATYPNSVSANTLIYASAANVVSALANGTTGQLLTATTSSNPSWSAAPTAINAINVQAFTATGAFTYTPTANMAYGIVELVGGGGGSGGVASASSSNIGASGGGASGAYARFLLTAAQVGASKTGSVGIAGTAGTAGNNAGGNGGDTTLATASAWTAGGGNGSAGVTGGSSGGTGAGGAGGTVTTGTGTIAITYSGIAGGAGVSNSISSTPFGIAGWGGKSMFGSGLYQFVVTGGSAGNAGTGYGGGAGGSYQLNNGASVAGASGANGIAIFTEFIT